MVQAELRVLHLHLKATTGRLLPPLGSKGEGLKPTPTVTHNLFLERLEVLVIQIFHLLG